MLIMCKCVDYCLNRAWHDSDRVTQVDSVEVESLRDHAGNPRTTSTAGTPLFTPFTGNMVTPGRMYVDMPKWMYIVHKG